MSDSGSPSRGGLEARVDRLESLVEDQQETIEAQRERLDEQAGDDDGDTTTVFSRRSLLQAAGVVGLAGYGTGVASADPQGQIGTGSDPLRALHARELIAAELGGAVTDGQAVSSLLGTGLGVDDRSLSAADAAGDHVDVTEDGETVTTDAEELAAGQLLSASAEEGTVTFDGESLSIIADGETVAENPADLTVGSALSASADDDGDTVTLDATLPAVADSSRSVLDQVLELNFNDNLTAVESGDGTVRVDADFSDSNSQTDVSDGGTTVVSSTGDIDFGTNLTASDDGDGTATVDANVSGATNWEEADSDDLLETVSPYTGIDVADVQADSLNGGVTGNTDLTSLTGSGLSISANSLGLTNDSVTVAGNSVSLGNSTGVDYVDLGDTGSSFPIPNGDLANSSVTVSAGNGLGGGGSASLGGSTTLAVATDGIGTDELDASAVAGSNLSGGGGTLDLDSTIVTDDLTLRGDSGDSAVAKIKLNSFASGTGGNIELVPRNRVECTGVIRPTQDDSFDLGTSTRRWKNVYAAQGVTTSSDARLKQNVSTLSGGLERLRDIRPVSYEFEDRDNPDKRLGFIAQELDDAVPEAVDHPDDEDAPLGVNYDMVLPVAVGAIQTQQDRIEELEEQNAELRERNADLEARLDAVAEQVAELAGGDE